MVKVRWKETVNAQWLGNLLLACTLVGIFSLHAGIGDLREAYDVQTAAFQAGDQKPMSTTYHLSPTVTHTVDTLRVTGENTARQHKVNLCKAFEEGFVPSDMGPFPWYTPGMECAGL